MVKKLQLTVAHEWSSGELDARDQSVVAVQLREDLLLVKVDAPFAGDAAPGEPAGRHPELWQFEVVELFLAAPQQPGRYLELEFSPHGHFLNLLFEAPRVPATEPPPNVLSYTAAVSGDRWHGQATIERTGTMIDLDRATVHANAFRLAGEPRRYELAFPLPGETPDFHQPSDFPELHWSS